MLGVPFLDRAIGQWFRPHALDDPVDRLNYFVTSTLLAFFAIMVSAKQYVGSPIQCWTPMEFRGGWEQYAEDYCFIQNTFYIPMDEEVPRDTEEREKAEIGYYQWVPIVLALQAVMFYIPNWIWKTLNRQSGVDISSTVTDARKLRALPSSSRQPDLAKLAEYLVESFDFKSNTRTGNRFLCFNIGAKLGSYVSMLYLFVKFLYLLNVMTQFFLLNHFLGTGYLFWGVSMMNDLINGREWMESGVFPRVTLCDFGVRKLANLHRYTVQCVLMINMFNEKIYLFIWFWFFFVFISTFINFVYCFIQLMIPKSREASCRVWLSQVLGGDNAEYRDDLLMRRFTHYGLQTDGVLVLRFIEGHAGALVAKDVAQALWKKYLQMHKTFVPHLGGESKSASPGIDDGPHEALYNPDKLASLMQTDYNH